MEDVDKRQTGCKLIKLKGCSCSVSVGLLWESNRTPFLHSSLLYFVCTQWTIALVCRYAEQIIYFNPINRNTIPIFSGGSMQRGESIKEAAWTPWNVAWWMAFDEWQWFHLFAAVLCLPFWSNCKNPLQFTHLQSTSKSASESHQLSLNLNPTFTPTPPSR